MSTTELDEDTVVSWICGEDEEGRVGGVSEDTLDGLITAIKVRHEDLKRIRGAAAVVGAAIQLRDTLPEELCDLTGRIESEEADGTVTVRLDVYSTGVLRFRRPPSHLALRHNRPTHVITGVDKACCYQVEPIAQSA